MVVHRDTITREKPWGLFTLKMANGKAKRDLILTKWFHSHY